MTREEAIEILKNATMKDTLSDQFSKAYVMAVQALEQQPCEDAVSQILKRMWNCRGKHTTSIDKVKMEQIIRDELSYDADIEYSQNMDAISKPTGIRFYDDDDAVSRDAVKEWLENATYEDICEAVGTNLDFLPSVTPSSPKGHWIIIDDCERFIAKCSECGRIEDSRMINKYPYCHCGAKMVESQERSDKE